MKSEKFIFSPDRASPPPHLPGGQGQRSHREDRQGPNHGQGHPGVP